MFVVKCIEFGVPVLVISLMVEFAEKFSSDNVEIVLLFL